MARQERQGSHRQLPETPGGFPVGVRTTCIIYRNRITLNTGIRVTATKSAPSAVQSSQSSAARFGSRLGTLKVANCFDSPWCPCSSAFFAISNSMIFPETTDALVQRKRDHWSACAVSALGGCRTKSRRRLNDSDSSQEATRSASPDFCWGKPAKVSWPLRYANAERNARPGASAV